VKLQTYPSPLSLRLMAAGLLVATQQAQAQTAPATPAAPTSSVRQKADGTQEIVVTAQKISQLASKTPVALTVVTGENLKDSGITDVRGLTDLVPNVQISQESGRNLINIRGVMAVDTTERGDPSNAFHIDGVYIGRPEAQLGAFMDVDRVEVLRGPQGTLYGKNATGGSINIISNKPAFKREGKLSVDIGNYRALRTEGVFNEKLSDSLAVRLAFSNARRDSYLYAGNHTEPMENQNDLSFRLSALWKVSADSSLLLTGEHSAQSGVGFTPIPLRNFYTGVGVAGSDAQPENVLNPQLVDYGTQAQLTMPGSGFVKNTDKDNKHDLVRAEYNVDFGWASLTYQGAFLRSGLVFDITGPANNGGGVNTNGILGVTNMPVEQQSHELRLASGTGGALRWVAGLFYMDEEIGLRRQFLIDGLAISQGPGPLWNRSETTNNAAAGFGQLTWSVLPSTRLVVGARYSQDEKTFTTYNWTTGALNQTRTASFSKSTYRLGVEHDLDKTSLLYASYSTGYKAGGMNDAGSTSPDIRPENLKALEAGIKGRFFSDRLQLSAAAYHYDYQDMQVKGVYCIVPQNCGAAITLNGNGATIKGLEFEGRLRVGASGVVNFAVGLNDATFSDFKSFNATGVQTWDISGQVLDRAPKSTVALGYAHDFALPGGAGLKVHLGTKYTSNYFSSSYSANTVFRYPQKAATRSDLTMTYTPAVGEYYAQLYVKNMENKLQVVNILQGAVNTSTPRTFGLRVGTSF
jgi:iron complex outermembrane recepter protein